MRARLCVGPGKTSGIQRVLLFVQLAQERSLEGVAQSQPKSRLMLISHDG